MYFGSLMYMIDGVIKSGVPDKDQTRGMVTGLWVVCDCIGKRIFFKKESTRDVLIEFHLKFWNTASIGIPARSLL